MARQRSRSTAQSAAGGSSPPTEERACEHLFVTAQDSALTRYRRAIESRSILLAELSAREMGFVTLPDALALVALYAAEGSPRFDKAATRWLARLALESDDL